MVMGTYRQGMLRRATRLLGEAVTDMMATRRVILFGVGGVGSWCAEALVRSGISRLTIVDFDRVCVTNINRQLLATSETVGKVKVEAMRDRLLSINPEAEITALNRMFTAETAADFHLEEYDYIIDCIDTLKDKVLLIRRATDTDAVFFSSMGAALKIDPQQIRTGDFWKVRGCPLGAALRKRIKQSRIPLRRSFRCVYSEELLANRGADPYAACAAEGDTSGSRCGTSICACRERTAAEVQAEPKRAQINGSLVHITAIFGMTLAGMVIQDINDRAGQQ